jgi:ATP-dependent DNA helicase PIF1
VAFANQNPFVSTSFDSATTTAEDTAFTDPAVLPVEFLNSLNFNGIPPHNLHLNVGQALMLIRNLDAGHGLCNGTRLVLKKAVRNLLTCVIATPGPFLGTEVLIPRCKLITDNCGMPFELCRVQFPVVPAWSMTINKSQGQTMSMVGLYLQTQCFSHGQLYVALSRASRINRIAVLSTDTRIPALPNDHLTRNVVYTSVLRYILNNGNAAPELLIPARWRALRWADAVPPPVPAPTLQVAAEEQVNEEAE